MKKILLLIGLSIIVLSCAIGAKKPELYVTNMGANAEMTEEIEKTYVYNKAYIELRVAVTDSGKYNAQKNLDEVDEDGNEIFYMLVTDKEGVILTYNTPVDFFN